MRFLTYTAFLSLCFIGLRALGLPAIHLAIPIICILAGIGIIGFVRLGQRAFNFFDPTQLSNAIFDNLNKQVDSITAGGFRWDDSSFQEHSRRVSKKSLDTLKTLSSFISREIHLKSEPYVQMVQNTIKFLIKYNTVKSAIPTESLWFEKRYKHKDWLHSSDSTIAMATRTGTQLNPEITHNNHWVEDTIFPIIINCLRTNLAERQLHLVIGLLEYTNVYIITLSKQGDFNQAFNRVAQITEEIIQIETIFSEKKLVETERLQLLAIIETQGASMIDIFLAYMEYLDDINREGISSKLKNINWKSNTDIYQSDFYSHILPQLEWLSSRIKFEVAIEGKVITPLWYQTELIAVIEANKMADCANSFVTESLEAFGNWISFIEGFDDRLLTSALISREWEYWNKISANFHRFNIPWKNLINQKSIEGLQWPNLNLESLDTQIQRRKKEILRIMANYSVPLIKEGRSDQIPDYGGQFHHYIAEGILEAIIKDDIELLKALFKPYFYSCLALFEKKLLDYKELKNLNWRDLSNIKIASAPLLDLIDISGYVHLLSEYHNNSRMWIHVNAIWDEYLGTESDLTNIFVSAVSLSSRALEIPHHSMIRRNWRQWISESFNNIPTSRIYASNPFREEVLIHHPSPLIRLFIKDNYSLTDGIDIFIYSYFRQQPDGAQMDYGRRGSNTIQRKIQLETEFYKVNIKEQEGDK
ncbi:hypothetical protein M3172_20630 [Mesobacillus subterraneus]|uniref:hypothetical protein n=1 Tax=Mesobacillus subterraneus TaxID=285983 RepID=UPI00204257BD|nr:hypothetical protein [Mesobacillus subterraneus]MCM3575602.1 hypothetical protein [Mesobacillus subterraneus]